VNRVTWFVLEVRPKAERKALTELRKAGIVDAYCPEYKIERFNRRRKVSIVTTLCHFPRYIFAQLEGRDFGALRSCNSIIDVLPGYPHHPMPVAAKDIEAIRDAEANMVFDDTDEARRRRGETVKNSLKAMRKRLKGKKIRVTDGPFTSFAGEVEAVHSLERLTVLINLFGQDTPVELEHGQIEELAA
jgi:transcription termination/antitermination protein NusG